MAKGRGFYHRGKYRFTGKRQAALKRAQAISANRRKGHGKKIGAIVGLAGISTVAVMGYKHRDAIGKSVSSWTNGGRQNKKHSDAQIAVAPEVKELTRTANAISVAPPSATTTVALPKTPTPITAVDRKMAEAKRKELDRASQAPRYQTAIKVVENEVGGVHVKSELVNLGGRDNKKYDAEGSVDSDAMTARSVRGTLRAAKQGRLKSDNTAQSITEMAEAGAKITRGRRTASNKGTPGGTRTPAKAVPRKTVQNGFTQEELQSHFDFIDTPQYQVQEDIYAGQKVASKVKKPKKAKKPKKPKAPTAVTNKTADSAPKIIKMSDMPDPISHINWKTANEAYNKQEAQRIAKEKATENSLFGSYEDPDW